MVTIKDETSAPSTPVVKTLNDVPVGQLFRGRVHFTEPTYGGYYEGIFRKYRGAWMMNGATVVDCLVVVQTGIRTVTWGTLPSTPSVPGASSFFLKCTQVDNYEPLKGVLTVTKA